jgi:hypothetical protein
MVKFISPDSELELCWASPEGIAISDDRLWLINDPVSEAEFRENYRELGFGQLRLKCEKRKGIQGSGFENRVPMLFAIPLDCVLPK